MGLFFTPEGDEWGAGGTLSNNQFGVWSLKFGVFLTVRKIKNGENAYQ